MEKEFLKKKALKSIIKKENTEEVDVESRLNLDEDNDIFTKEVEKLSTFKYVLGVCKNLCIKIASFAWDWIKTIFLAIVNIFVSVYKIARYGTMMVVNFFKGLAHKFKYNDAWGRLSFLVFGAGSFGHKQYVNGALYLLFEIGYILFIALIGAQTLTGIWDLGSIRVQPGWAASDGNFTFQYNVDNSLLRLIAGLFVLLSMFIFIYIWLRSINAGYNNYRISKFNEYKTIHEKCIPFSNKVDEYISKLYKEHQDELYEYLLRVADSEEKITEKAPVLKTSKKDVKNALLDLFKEYYEKADNKFEKNYLKYVFNETIADSLRYYKDYYKLINKKDKYNVQYHYVLELNKQANQLILEDENLTEEQKEAKIDSKLLKDKRKEHRYEDKVTVVAKSISDKEKTHSPFASKLSRINYNTYAKFNNYFNVISSYNVDIRFYKAYSELVEYYQNIGGSYQNENQENEVKKVEVRHECEEKIAAIDNKYAVVYEKKKAILDNKKLIQDDLKLQLSVLRGRGPEVSEHLANDFDEDGSYTQFVKDRLNELTTVCEVIQKEISLVGLTKKEIAIALYTERINKLDGQYNSFASDKILVSLQKEEKKLVAKRAKDDIKYLKTNFTKDSYASEETINKMLVDYDFDYGYARKNVELIRENYSADVVAEKIKTLESKRDEYIENHSSTKFVGKAKTFIAQIKSLFNDKFHVTILTLPVIGAVIFSIIPLVFSILIAFTNFDKFHLIGVKPFEWTGFETFIKMFEGTDPVFGAIGEAIGATFLWTFVWALFATFTNYFLGIIVALMINKDGIRLKKLWRTLFVLTIAVPQFISLSTIAKMLASGGAGVLNNIYQSSTGVSLGFAVDIANNALVTKIIIIIVNVWVGIPYTILSTTGILMNIPKDLYESSRIDGAGPATQFFKITMPYILFVTGPSLITNFIGNFNNFGVIFFLTGGAPRRTSGSAIAPGFTDLFITYIYTLCTSDTNKYYNVASALGIIIFIVCSFISIIMYNKTGAVSKEDQFQ